MAKPPQPPADPERPSKSQRKRDMHALQALAESLVELPDAQLAEIPMPDVLREAVLETRRMRKRGALHRQRQYLGKLMREIDAGPIRAALARLQDRRKLEVARFKRVEAWRDRLVDDDAALGDLVAEHPETDRQHVRSLVRAARRERAEDRPPKASRTLFRYLDELLGQTSV